MQKYRFGKDIKRFLMCLQEDLFLNDVELENAFKLADKVDFVGKPSVIAVSIIYHQIPELYDLIMTTWNITNESLYKTVEKLKMIE